MGGEENLLKIVDLEAYNRWGGKDSQEWGWSTLITVRDQDKERFIAHEGVWYGSHIRGLLEWGEGTSPLPRILFWALATGNDLRVQIFLVLPAILPTKTIATLTHWALSLTVTSLIPSDSQVLSILWSLLNVGPPYSLLSYLCRSE